MCEQTNFLKITRHTQFGLHNFFSLCLLRQEWNHNTFVENWMFDNRLSMGSNSDKRYENGKHKKEREREKRSIHNRRRLSRKKNTFLNKTFL